MMTGEEYATTKNKYNYKLSGEGKETTCFSFMVTEVKIIHQSSQS